MILNPTIVKKGTKVTIPEWATATASSRMGLIAYGDGVFVELMVYSSNGNNVAGYSTDGITWTTVTLPVIDKWTYLVYGNGTFAAAGSVNNSVIYSTDGGRTWNQGTYPFTNSLNCLGYGNGKFIITGGSSSDLAYSSDCITWTKRTGTSPSFIINRIAYGNGVFVGMTSKSGTKFCYSYDGNAWNSGTIPSFQCQSITYADGVFVALGATALYSTDGITWSTVSLPVTGTFNSIAHGNGKFVALGYNSTNVIYSFDGTLWLAHQLPASGNWSSIAYGNSKFVAVSEKTTTVIYGQEA